jgi:hypothetical protein
MAGWRAASASSSFRPPDIALAARPASGAAESETGAGSACAAPARRLVALPASLPVALILFHHLGERRKRRSGVASALPGAVNRGDLAGNRREAEAIHQQMVITLIPVPAVFADRSS